MDELTEEEIANMKDWPQLEYIKVESFIDPLVDKTQYYEKKYKIAVKHGNYPEEKVYTAIFWLEDQMWAAYKEGEGPGDRERAGGETIAILTKRLI